MGKKKIPKIFHIGKGIKKNDSGRIPIKGEPNSNLDTYIKKTGRFSSRRKFGSDGFAVKDYDARHDHYPFPHLHDFDGTERSKVHRAPQKKEKREFEKAMKKRRLW